VLSCAAGAAFVYAVLRLSRRLAPEVPWLVVLGLLGGGYIQLFFGDIENYTLTAALVTFYLLTALRFLEGEVGLWVPTVLLAVAICFHLLAGWLIPLRLGCPRPITSSNSISGCCSVPRS
jgi:hypothetical protein